MEEDEFISIINQYNNFRKSFSDNIIDSSINVNNENCYLIEENWIDNFREGINKYKNLKKENKLNKEFDYNDLLPDEGPNIINNFSSILKSIQDNKKIRCINQKLIEIIYESDLKDDELCIKYYSGNNKIIIKYENDNKSILWLDPLNKKEIKNNIKIILIKDDQKLNLFKNLLSKNNYPENYLNYILPIDAYSNILKNILKLFIYFYYYDKELEEYNNNSEGNKKFSEEKSYSLENRPKKKKATKKLIFNKKDGKNYYLINSFWLNKFKDFFNYSEICKTLKSKEKKNIDYINLSNYYDKIISELYEKDILISKTEFFGEIFSPEKVISKTYSLYNISYHKNCYIINSQIMNIIKSIFNGKEINIKSKKIYFSNNSVYEFNENKVIIGNLNGELAFIPKYIIVYDSNEIFESEKNNLLENTIENYIKEFKCDSSNTYSQILKNNKGNIGKLIIFQNIREKSDKKRKKKFIENSDIQYIGYAINESDEEKQLEVNNNQQSLNNKNDSKNTYKNNSKENNPEKDKEIIEIKDVNEKNNNTLKQNKILKQNNENFLQIEKEFSQEKIKNKDYKLKENELINSNKKLHNQITYLEKTNNNYEEKNNKLREKENIINDYKNKYLKLENELKIKNEELKDYLNIQKKLENKENEIININKKLEDCQNYIKN